MVSLQPSGVVAINLTLKLSDKAYDFEGDVAVEVLPSPNDQA